jgi:hypothetical protein
MDYDRLCLPVWSVDMLACSSDVYGFHLCMCGASAFQSSEGHNSGSTLVCVGRASRIVSQTRVTLVLDTTGALRLHFNRMLDALWVTHVRRGWLEGCGCCWCGYTVCSLHWDTVYISIEFGTQFGKHVGMIRVCFPNRVSDSIDIRGCRLDRR